jgi:NADPH2:quinone reductase
MKRIAAHMLDGIEALAIEDAPVPEPGPGEVRLKVAAVGLGFVDGLVISGQYQWKPPLPYVPGGEIAGVIDAVGPGVADWGVGQRVATWQMGGGLAEFCLVPAGDLVCLPAGLEFETAAAVLLDYATADYALHVRGRLQPGETVLVLGANGGVGHAAMQLAKAEGATVIAGVSCDRRRELALRKGARATVDLSLPAWREELRTVTGGKAPDIVVDPLGGAFTEAAFRSLAKRGRHLVIGFAAQGIPSLPVNLALLKNADLIGIDIRDFCTQDQRLFIQRLLLLFDRIVRSEIDAPALSQNSLSSFEQAFRSLQQRGRTGKLIITVPPETFD